MIQILYIKGLINELSFFSDESYLKTNHRVLELSSLCHPLSQPQSNYLTHLYVKEQWIAWKMDNILWLPPSYRATCMTVQNDNVALGHTSGQVTLIRFDAFLYASQGDRIK